MLRDKKVVHELHVVLKCVWVSGSLDEKREAERPKVVASCGVMKRASCDASQLWSRETSIDKDSQE